MAGAGQLEGPHPAALQSEAQPRGKAVGHGQDATSNQVFTTLEAIREKVVNEVNQLRDNARWVTRLIGDGWLLWNAFSNTQDKIKRHLELIRHLVAKTDHHPADTA